MPDSETVIVQNPVFWKNQMQSQVMLTFQVSLSAKK